MTSLSAPRKSSKAKAAKPADTFSLTAAINHQCYNVEPIPAGEFGTRAFRLTKHSAKDFVYDVIRTDAGIVECDCPSYEVTYKGSMGLCKHGSALVKLGLLDAPSWTPPAEVAPTGDEAPAPAPCCAPAEARPCLACVEAEPAGFADATADAILEDGPLAPKDDAPDPLADLPFPRPARTPFLRPAPAPLPRPVVPDGRYDLAGLVMAQGDAYAALDNAVGELIAETLRDLAVAIKETGAVSVAQYRDRAEALEAGRADELRSSYYDRGYVDAMERVAGDAR